MKEYNIALLGGDGIGPEVTDEAVKVLNAVGKKYDMTFNFTKALIGGCAYEKYGVPLPDETLEIAKNQMQCFWALSAIGSMILSRRL